MVRILDTALERLAKLRAKLPRRDYAGALLSDPINIRYATGSSSMTVWTLHAPGRYVFVPTDGPVVLFEYGTQRSVDVDANATGPVSHSELH